jgi:hypothetical protein
MIVSAEMGKEGSFEAKFPYEFYGKINKADLKTHIIHLVMPVGGKESGLFRYPKADESVLVDKDEAGAYYLLGYLPNGDPENNFLSGLEANKADEKNALQDETGMVLRYEQTGKKDPSTTDVTDRYSEIGFYHQPTQWVPSKTDGYKAVDTTGIPRIDHLNIHSTGDIHTSANNHQRMKAKRIEILSNVEMSDFSKELKEGNRPFGDQEGDDSNLYAGDAHIRAKNRIIIKAGESIELRVGRSSIIINDEGIIIASRKTQSNVYNSWDTLLALKASKGITLFGQHVNIRGGIDYTLSEGYGGSLSSRLGVVRLMGFDIRTETLNTFNYLTRGIGNGVDFLFNAGTLISGSAEANSSISKHTGNLSTSPALNFFASKGSSEATGGPDFQGIMLSLLDILLLLLMVVEIALDMAIPKVHKRDNHGRDGLYTALALVEYGLLLECFRELCSPSFPYAIFESSLHLTSKADVLIDGYNMKNTVMHNCKANSPLAGVSPKTAKGAYKDGWKQFLVNLLGKLKENKAIVGAGLSAGLLVAGGLITGMVLSNQQDKELEEQLRSL